MDRIEGDREGVWDGVLVRAAAWARSNVVALSRLAKSPIEARFLAAFWDADSLYSKTAWDDGIEIAFAPLECATGRIDIQSQAPVGPYLADFRIDVTILGGRQSFVVELDGHDFHEKTREQVAHDKKRDRFFIVQGLPALRFSGSEIWNNAPACAAEVVGYIDTLTNRGNEQRAKRRRERRRLQTSAPE